ncbi:MAG TPA: hypothetical protein VFN72_06530 [Solirubrobacterales bacterium]|nr:hypothetical protein [Solirubrobacterales bacterium]
MIGAEFGLGLGVDSLKSVALLFVSSASSRAVGQFAAIERMMALPSPIAPAVPLPWNGEPAESGSTALPVKAPQETQSSKGGSVIGQQTAPAAGFRLRLLSVKSGVTPGNAAAKPLSATTAVALFELFATGAGGEGGMNVETLVPLAE